MAVATFAPAGTVVTASGNSSSVDTGVVNVGGQNRAAQNLSVSVLASAVGGTSPSLTVEVQWSNDNINFSSVQGTTDAFTAITANGNAVKQFPVKGKYALLKYTVSGTTPTFTLNCTAYLS